MHTRFLLFVLLVAHFMTAEPLPLTSLQPDIAVRLDVPAGEYPVLAAIEGITSACFTFEGKPLSSMNRWTSTSRYPILHYDATCGQCGPARVSIAIPALNAKAEIEVNLECRADVLLATTQRLKTDVRFSRALGKYIDTLRRRGLSAQYVVLDSPRARSHFITGRILTEPAPVTRRLELEAPGSFVIFDDLVLSIKHFVCARQKEGRQAEKIPCNGANPNAIEFELFPGEARILMDDPKGLKPAGSGILTQREPYVINAKAGRRIFLEKVTYLGPEKLKVEGMAREDYAKAQIRVVGAHHAQKSQPNWDSVKKALKAVMDQVKPKYTILLGGDDILPYPQYNFEDYDEVFGYLLMGGTGIRLASDDYYATRNGRAKKSDVPDQIVSRMPTWRGKDSSELVSVQLESASAPEPRSARGLIVTDAAGDDQRSLFKRAEKASQALFRKGCAPAHCLPAPPYCTGALNSQGKEVPSDRCSQGPSLQAKITSADVIFTYLHGGVNAQGISAGKKEPPVYAVFHPEDFTVKRPAMRAKIDLKARHPVIFSTGCSAAEADLSCGCSDKSCSFVRGQAGIGISMLSGGARTLFGFTRDLSALSANALDLRVVKSLKSGKTAGEAFLDAKKTALEEGDVRRLRAKTREQKSEATADLFWARSFILYGDPTVTVRLP